MHGPIYSYIDLFLLPLDIGDQEILSEEGLRMAKNVVQDVRKPFSALTKCYKKYAFLNRASIFTAIFLIGNKRQSMTEELGVATILRINDSGSLDMTAIIWPSKHLAEEAVASNHVLRHRLWGIPQNWLVKVEKLDKSKCASFRTDLSIIYRRMWDEYFPGWRALVLLLFEDSIFKVVKW